MKQLIEERRAALEQIKELQTKVEELDDAIYEKVKDRVKDQGSTTIRDNGYKITVNIPMRPTWDESKLREIAERIRTSGDDPEEYISYKLTVPESKYKAWPAPIQEVFHPARTVKPGKRSFKIEEEG